MRGTRLLLLVLGAGLGAITIPSPSYAQQQPSWIRNRSAADYQALEQRRNQLSRQLNISRAALNEIFRRLGLPPEIPLARALSRITEAANDARTFRNQAREFENALKELGRTSVRDPGLVALRAAEAAFENGDIDGAAAELERLDRVDLTIVGDDLQLRYYRTRANLERLRGNTDAALALLDRGAQLADRERWRFAIDRGEIRLQRSRDTRDRFGSDEQAHREDLQLAIAAFRDEALPLVPRQREPRLWATTQRMLGSALFDLGTDGPFADTPDEAGRRRRQALEEARTALDAAVSEERLRDDREEWLLAWFERGEVYTRLARRDSDPGLARIAVTSFDLVIANVMGNEVLKYWDPGWYTAGVWRGEAVLLIAETTRDPAVIAALRADMIALHTRVDAAPEYCGNAEMGESPSAILSSLEELAPELGSWQDTYGFPPCPPRP